MIFEGARRGPLKHPQTDSIPRSGLKVWLGLKVATAQVQSRKWKLLTSTLTCCNTYDGVDGASVLLRYFFKEVGIEALTIRIEGWADVEPLVDSHCVNLAE